MLLSKNNDQQVKVHLKSSKSVAQHSLIKNTFLVVLELRMASDKNYLCVINEKLKFNEMKWNMLSFISSYISNRAQNIQIDDLKSAGSTHTCDFLKGKLVVLLLLYVIYYHFYSQVPKIFSACK